MSRVPSSRVVLDSAYRCFCRNGYRRSTMSAIVEEAQLSRPTVYKYGGTKDEAFAKVVEGLLAEASAAAGRAASAGDTPGEKALGVLSVKLEVAIRLWRDSPAHAYELLADALARTPELVSAYMDHLTRLLAPRRSSVAR